MKVAFRLRRLAEAAPATALLLPSQRPEDVLRVCAGLGCDPLPEIYPLADGFILKLPAGTSARLVGVHRLRSLADNLLLPVDAELVPALLEDEAAALGRQRGLVFLPGGRVLEFAPQAPLPLAALVGLTGVRRRPWRSLPDRPALAERLTELALDQPDESPEALLEAGGEGIGTDGPRPADSGAPAKALGKVAFNVGKGMAWLGSVLHLGGLARAGAHLMAGAMNLAPRLSEALLGKQEASLRDLLRDFREGNIERALRRALPLGGDTERGARPAQDTRLPWHNLFYSLQNILSRSGPPSIWFGRFDAYHELQREYRKQAELATRAGDYRRAAFIYGKLLSDFRSAAAVLAQGGLHHDAAILYLTKVHDSQAAAQEFEAAGEIDRALKLYRQLGKHALAGDLLRRAGEEELAVAEYRLAAARLVESGQGHYQAGELLLVRARRPDLAREYYETGWQARPAGSPVPCAIRLAQLHAQRESAPDLLTLLGEGEDFLAPPGNDTPAAEFFNEIARLANRPALARLRDDLRDRALLALAAKMRQRVADRHPGDLAGTMLAPSSKWGATLVSDAAYAVKAAPRKVQPLVHGPVTRIAIAARVKVVTAVCQAPATGEIFLSFQSGEVFRFRPLWGEVTPITNEPAPVTSLATDVEGEELVILRPNAAAPGSVRLSRYTGSASWHRTISQLVQTTGDPWLCALLAQDRVGLWNGTEFLWLSTTSLLTTNRRVFDAELTAALALPPAESTAADPALMAFEAGELVHHAELPQRRRSTWTVNWAPTLPADSSLQWPTLSWLCKGPEAIELAGIGPEGSVYWSDVEFQNGLMARVATRAATGPEPFRAVTIVRAGLLAAVTGSTVQWLRRSAEQFQVAAVSKHSLPPPVACYPHYRGKELIVICNEGTVARVPQLLY
jgi:hypothetical protein